LLNNAKISSLCSAKLQALAGLCTNELEAVTPSQIAYNKFATDVIAIENTIGGSTLSAIEKQYVYTACSVARNSAAYWGTYQLNPPPVVIESTGRLKVENVKPKPKFNWGNVAKGDVAGAIGGAYGGAAAGALAGGVGAGPGALAGAVGGGIAGSVGVAVYQIFNWS